MKKSILKIGKALTKAEQKQVFGGEQRRHDDECNVNETTFPPPGCPCWIDTQCINMVVNTIYGPTLASGTCNNGVCEV